MSCAPPLPWHTRLRAFTEESVMQPLFETVMHPSEWRIRALGLSTCLGHPLFHLVWSRWLPQPYEVLWQRLLMSLLGLVLLMAPSLRVQPPTRGATWLFTSIFWVTLPVYFTWMYLCNGRNTAWFASMAAMFLIYYHLTDWRIASAGLLLGLPAAWGLYSVFGAPTPALPLQESATHAVVLGFAWGMGLILGLSSFNLRRLQLRQTLATVGIIAHELRTPLATVSLIGDALRNEAQHARDTLQPQADSLAQLAGRLHHMVHGMNRQIDLQITNARLMNLPRACERVSAAQAVLGAVAAYPFRHPRERECVQAHVIRDFHFHSLEPLFVQVVNNLMKNALRALAAMPGPPRPGDLRIEVRQTGSRGHITVSDRGPGIDPQLLPRLFQPFVSTQSGTGHGLGLAFCQRVVREANGHLHVESVPGAGARFTIDLPAVTRTPS